MSIEERKARAEMRKQADANRPKKPKVETFYGCENEPKNGAVLFLAYAHDYGSLVGLTVLLRDPGNIKLYNPYLELIVESANGDLGAIRIPLTDAKVVRTLSVHYDYKSIVSCVLRYNENINASFCSCIAVMLDYVKGVKTPPIVTPSEATE